jgi:hypothetical protein
VNRYVELTRSFQFLECATRQKEVLTRCRHLPTFLAGRPVEASLRDYLFCLTLVSAVAQLEADLEHIRGVPDLHRTGLLSSRLRLLRDHFQVSGRVYGAVDQIRVARNRFVHEQEVRVDAGCTKAEVPGIMVTFLQHCRHPDYR